MGTFYDGTELLSLRDLDGNPPEIRMVESNRSDGKTTYFNRLLINHILRGQTRKFGLIYRYSYELQNVSDKFFNDIHNLFFPDYFMTSESRMKGIYHELFLNKKSVGYAFSLNAADQIKKNSHFFSDVDEMLMDEFQSETNHYCPNEITKFLSLHISISRGGGKQKRYVPVYMLSNPVTLLNPYYTAMGISSRLQSNTRFLKGHGFVLERHFNENASKLQQESGVMKAFASTDYAQYTAQSTYLNDNYAFIEQPEGIGRYLCTLVYKNSFYALKEYANKGIIFVDDRADKTYRLKIAVTTEDHNVNYIMLKRNADYISMLRQYFDLGCFRFKNLMCKEALMTCLSYI